ncbi:MAG: putative Ig domain-containing protein, partial [Planctomycetia bacterium]
FAVVWQSDGIDGAGFSVQARMYDAAGAASTGFRVNVFTTGDQSNPSVAMDADGDFVVAWASANQDGSGSGVYARRYDAGGAAQGGEFAVNTTTAGAQTQARTAMDADGDFVVVWRSEAQDGDVGGVYGRRFDAAGAPAADEFLVNTVTASTQSFPVAAMDADGDFVVSWSSYAQDGSSYGVYLQRYAATGEPVDAETLVNDTTDSGQFVSAVAMDDAGNFVVAWTSQNQDGDVAGVFAKRFGADLQPPALADPADRSVNEGTPLAFALTLTNPSPSNPAIFQITAGAALGMTLDPNTGLFAWTPNEVQNGVYSVTFRATDGDGDFSEQTVVLTVLEVNAPPTLAAIGGRQVVEGTLLTFQATAADLDAPTNRLTFSLAGIVPTGATIDPTTGVFLWTPTAAQGPGTYTFAVVVSDGAATDAETIVVTVGDSVVVVPNRAPVLSTRRPPTLTASSRGALVAALVRGRITDADAGSRRGIALTRLSGSGQWQYQRNGRGAWRAIRTATAARPFLLPSEARLRFVRR